MSSITSAVENAFAAAGTGAPTGRTRIGRQSVHDPGGAVVGYELLFHPGPGLEHADPEARDRSTSEVISTAFGEFGLDRLGVRRNLYVNMTRTLLTGELPMPFGPHNIVLELLDRIEVDLEVLEGVRQLKQRGFRLAIDGYVGGPEHARLVPLVDVVKVDVAAMGDDLPELVAYLGEAVPQARLLADGVADRAALDACRRAAFDLYQGPHFERPRTTPTAAVPPSQAISLQLLAALSDPDTSMAEIERIVSADPGLSVRVLSTVNSASGAGHRITSLRQGIVLLGRRSLSARVMLAALGGNPESRREDMVQVLTRARTTELLFNYVDVLEPPAAYAAGLFSAAVDILGADPAHLARSARLDAEMTAALVDREGRIGTLLLAIEEFEQTGRTTFLIPTREVSRAHLHALGTAIDTIDAILGPPQEPASERGT